MIRNKAYRLQSIVSFEFDFLFSLLVYLVGWIESIDDIPQWFRKIVGKFKAVSMLAYSVERPLREEIIQHNYVYQFVSMCIRSFHFQLPLYLIELLKCKKIVQNVVSAKSKIAALVDEFAKTINLHENALLCISLTL